MTTKLTLTLDDAVIKRAKKYASEQNTSLSRMVENYFKRITIDSAVASTLPFQDEAAPITSRLTGVAASKSVEGKSDKELLLNALQEKYLK